MSSLYVISLRLSAATEQVVEKAVADKTSVRSWPMRGTIHFMPPEDARWMLKLLAHRQNIKFTGMYRKAGLTSEIFARAGEVFAKALQGGKQLMRKDMYEALAEAYGWDDLDLGQGFHETKQGVRYTISEAARREVLGRLLKLNHERYAEEEAMGLHEKGAKKGKGQR